MILNWTKKRKIVSGLLIFISILFFSFPSNASPKEIGWDDLIPNIAVSFMSSLFDPSEFKFNKKLNDTQVKIYAWYDNEVGYTHRLVDIVEMVGNKI